MGKYLDLTGQVFGRLTALTQVIPLLGGRAKWICICECGTKTLVQTGHLINQAVTARNTYILENNLPFKLQ